MRVALIDSGFGLLPTAGWLRHLRPDLALDLVMDPAGMPWGGRSDDWLVERVLAAGQQAAARGADALVVACNTASVSATVPLRAAVEPARPVVATVPAVKPAAATGEPFAVWATEHTSGSEYQRSLLEAFSSPGQASPVACPGLADAVEAGRPQAVGDAVAVAAARTPATCRAVVLGCTHYPLVVADIVAALPAGVRLFDSSRAVAGQALRRLGLAEDPEREPAEVRVFLSGDPGAVPEAARSYPIGAALAAGGRVGRADLPATVDPVRVPDAAANTAANTAANAAANAGR